MILPPAPCHPSRGSYNQDAKNGGDDCERNLIARPDGASLRWRSFHASSSEAQELHRDVIIAAFVQRQFHQVADYRIRILAAADRKSDLRIQRKPGQTV